MTDGTPPARSSTIVAFVPDLMDRSKVSSAAAGRVTFVQRADALASAATAAGADLVLVDLARPGVVDAVAAVATLEPRPVIVGFGSHVDRDTLAAATGAGADRVLARSAFFGDIVGALA